MLAHSEWGMVIWGGGGGGRAVSESVAQSKGTHFQKPVVEHDQVLGFTASSRFLQSCYLCGLYRKNEAKH